MLSIKNQLALLLFLVFSASAAQTIAQENLRSDSLFFQETLTNYQLWLDSTNLSNIFIVKELNVADELITLHFEMENKEDWISLRNDYEEKYKQEIGAILFSKFVFEMEIERSQAWIRINCPKDDYPIDIYYENNKIVVKELLPDVALKNGNTINLKGITGNGTTISRHSLGYTKKLIRDYFKGYFHEKTVWGKHAKFEAIEFEEAMYLEISNIKRELLYDFTIGYFELILIEFQFEEREGEVEVKYTIQGKYGSGVFIAPRRSGYKSMEPKFMDYMDRYRKKFRASLEELLRSEFVKN